MLAEGAKLSALGTCLVQRHQRRPEYQEIKAFGEDTVRTESVRIGKVRSEQLNLVVAASLEGPAPVEMGATASTPVATSPVFKARKPRLKFYLSCGSFTFCIRQITAASLLLYHAE